MAKLIRQGDVILREIRALPQYVSQVDKTREFDGMVVSPDGVTIRGETGHAHVLSGVKTYTTWDRTVYVVVEKPTVLRHDEHPAIEIPKGIYVVTHVQDYALSRHNRRYLD
jgi:hypothetical protein